VSTPTIRFAALALALAGLLLAGPAAAETLSVDIYGPGQSRMHMALADPMADTPDQPAPTNAGALRQHIKSNLEMLPFLGLIPSENVLGSTRLQGYKAASIDFKRFQLAGADLLLTSAWPDDATVELRVYEVFTKRLVVGKAYDDVTPARLQQVADLFCAAFMEALTGHGEFFRSTLAYVQKAGDGGKHVWVVHPTGRNPRRVTNLPGYALSPSWSKDGRFIVFSHIGERRHELGVWERATGEVKTRALNTPTVISPTFTRGNRIAVSLGNAGYTDIVQLDRSYRRERVLVDSRAIDVSPDFDHAGRRMVFVSDRYGSPQIFMLDTVSGKVRRITYKGGYNTDPSISPDGKLIVFSRMTQNGHRIFLHEVETGLERQLTFGPGSDEQPAFAPDGYFVAFTSTRSGPQRIYLTTRHGDRARRVPTGPGAVSFPAWGFEPGAR
jgi:TolB protein